MREVEAAKTAQQRHPIEAHLSQRGQIYAGIWRVGVNTALRISDLLSLTMQQVRALDPTQPALRLTEQKTGKRRKIVINQAALAVVQQCENGYLGCYGMSGFMRNTMSFVREHIVS